MLDGEDWLMRPVLAGLVGYEELKRRRLDLCDWATMHDALDVQQENEAIARRVNK